MTHRFVPASATVTGKEDTPYIFNWRDFKVSDWDSTDTTLTINALPASGLLQLNDGQSWTAVAAGQRILRGDVDAGKLRFKPADNQSGCAGYNTPGFGDMKTHYASFAYQANDDIFTSDVANMILDVTPVADSPSLALATPPGAYGATSTLFSTSWESAPNWGDTSTILPQSTLEGWNVVRQTGDTGQSAFVICSSGNRMKDDATTKKFVAATPGDGNNWLEIGNGRGQGHQTYGIEHTVDTRAGMTYKLSLDYAGRPGCSADSTTIGIYVDGVRIGTHAGTSPEDALNWESLSFSFTGTGATQTIRIVTESTAPQSDEHGAERGAMLDNIALAEILPVNTGYQDAPFHLSNIVAAPTETNGSDLLTVMIGAIPAGTLLSDGTNNFTATDVLNTTDITGWNLTALTLTAPLNFTGTFALTVTARCTEIANGDTAESKVSLLVTVQPARFSSSLVIDLSGEGERTRAQADSADTPEQRNNDKATDPSRIFAEDGILAIDSTGSGRIANGSQLFGGTIGDAYAKLASFDSNHDGVIDARDARFNELMIWQDANGNHQSDPGELHSLGYWGIQSLNLNPRIVPEVPDGNWLLQRGKVTFKDGHTATMADAYYETAPQNKAQADSTNVAQQTSPATTRTGSAPIQILPEAAQPQIFGIPLGIKTVRQELGPVAAKYFAGKVARPAAVINWNTDATATSNPTNTDDANKKKLKAKETHRTGGYAEQGWITDFLGVAKNETKVTDTTGLNVSTPVVEEVKQPFVERRQRVIVAPDGTKLLNDR